MSLINDALKRASQAQKDRDASPPQEQPTSSGPALVPVEARRRSAPPFILPALLVVALTLGAWFLWGWWRTRSLTAASTTTQPASVARSTPAADSTAAPPGPKVNLTPVSRPLPSAPVAAPATGKPLKTAPAPPTAVAAAPPAPPVVATPARQEFPALKLQGIYYRLSGPSALINGKTLYVGDEIDDAKLMKIERFSVTMQFGAESKVLKLQ